ncbi:hypothetical protein EVS84_22710 [Pseudomonas koreensis]|uniref:Uncharacterized protein n=2 Tax=Pseudomonas TaxID=286 RepID=A0A4Q4KWM9_9PSED|nr:MULTISPECIES: hypothetical protein [Pseudomonas]MDM8192938.1 hypothetical protein [Pseudomonas fluorescens]MDP8574183.1 hypothetical protein [Pseudomonas iranensis]RYM38556.1 hypothetical protein EVS84_22710 [Pseudomonas koreensis]
MSLAKINNKAFTANLYLDGRPVVLNQQRLQQVLRDKRITLGEKLEAEAGLASLRTSSFITLADHEDDDPLVLKFVPQGDCYAVHLVHPSAFDGARMFIEDKTHNLLASTSATAQYFSISTYGAPKASLNDIASGPAHIELNSEPKDKPLYRQVSSGMSSFLDTDPNVTGHNAFNNKPARFVIKVLE